MRYKLGRFFQFLGLVILPAAIAGNLADSLTLWQSLSLSASGMLLFYIGWLLQQGTQPK
jgi:hypothetical protein